MKNVWSQAWENGLGTRAYQPRLPDGRSLWKDEIDYVLWEKERPTTLHNPDLFKSRVKAEQIARERHDLELKYDWRRVFE